jgi:nucleotide-binding universal stress UspA family protein
MTMEALRSRVVVGYDGGPDGKAALAWAIRTAHLQRRPIRVVVAANAMDPVLISDFHERTERLAKEWRVEAEIAVDEARLRDASVSVVHGPAVAVLLRSVTPADLLVVGCRGHAPFVETVGGSVSQHLARHAACPVVVVRPPAETASGILVGVDGSPESLAAARFACGRARLTQEDVTVLHAHRSWMPHPATGAETHAAWLHDWISPVVEEYDDLHITEEVVDGSASKILGDRSVSASLLVVGCRGRDAFVDLLLGSTSQDVLHRAHCPVAIVR